ncbi:MAG: GYD domain-containing protein [Candidatus Limnocylindria bacterium]
MPRYISLISFTEKGIGAIKDWDKRVAAGRERAEKAGAKLVDVYLTFGDYDAVVIADYPDDEAALRGALEYGLTGYGRTRTMRAFGEAEAVRVTKSL